MKIEVSGAAKAWAAFSIASGLAYSSIRRNRIDVEHWIKKNQISDPDYEPIEIEIWPVGAEKVK